MFSRINSIANNVVANNQIFIEGKLSSSAKKTTMVALGAIASLSVATYFFGKVGLIVTGVVLGSSVLASFLLARKETPEVIRKKEELSQAQKLLDCPSEEDQLKEAISSITEKERLAIFESIKWTVAKKLTESISGIGYGVPINNRRPLQLIAWNDQFKNSFMEKINDLFANPQRFIQDGLEMWVGEKKDDCRLTFKVEGLGRFPLFSVQMDLETQKIFSFTGKIDGFVDAAERKTALHRVY